MPYPSLSDIPTSAKRTPIYCSTLSLPPRTTHIAFDLVITMSDEGWYAGHPHEAITAACIWTAGQLVKEGHRASAEDIVRVVGVKNMQQFWDAYRKVWEKRDGLVTGNVQCHGADVGRLPEPDSICSS